MKKGEIISIKKEEFKKLHQLACADWKTKLDNKLVEFLYSDTMEFTVEFVEEMEKASTKEQLPVFNKIFESYLKTKKNLFSANTYSKVCNELDEIEVTAHCFDSDIFDQDEIEKLVAFAKLTQLERYYNNGSKANHWYPYFTKDTSGLVGFVSSGVWSGSSDGRVALFKDKETSDFVGKTYFDLYKVICK